MNAKQKIFQAVKKEKKYTAAAKVNKREEAS